MRPSICRRVERSHGSWRLSTQRFGLHSPTRRQELKQAEVKAPPGPGSKAAEESFIDSTQAYVFCVPEISSPQEIDMRFNSAIRGEAWRQWYCMMSSVWVRTWTVVSESRAGVISPAIDIRLFLIDDHGGHRQRVPHRPQEAQEVRSLTRGAPWPH